jgi:hypothetical protein
MGVDSPLRTESKSQKRSHFFQTEGRYSEAKALLSEAHIIRTRSALEDQKTVDHIGYNCGSMEGYLPFFILSSLH